MSDAAAALAAPLTVKHKDKDYPLSPLNLDMIAMFERWLENRAFETIEVRKGQIPEDDYERLLSAWIEQCASGRYRWGGPAALSASKSAAGLRFLVFLMLAEKTPGMTPKFAAEIFDNQLDEVRAKMEVVNASPFVDPAKEPTTATA